LQSKVDGEWQVHIPASDVTRQDAIADRQEDQQDSDRTPTVDLSPLADLIERQARELADLREAATIWQIRARQAEEQLKQLTAGETHAESAQVSQIRQDAAPEAVGSSQGGENVSHGHTGLWERVRRLWGR